MAAQGQAATDLAAFDKSEKMTEIRNLLEISAEEGNVATVFMLESLGNSREAIFTITLLRKQGYTVNHTKDVIIVK